MHTGLQAQGCTRACVRACRRPSARARAPTLVVGGAAPVQPAVLAVHVKGVVLPPLLHCGLHVVVRVEADGGLGGVGDQPAQHHRVGVLHGLRRGQGWGGTGTGARSGHAAGAQCGLDTTSGQPRGATGLARWQPAPAANTKRAPCAAPPGRQVGVTPVLSVQAGAHRAPAQEAYLRQLGLAANRLEQAQQELGAAEALLAHGRVGGHRPAQQLGGQAARRRIGRMDAKKDWRSI